jgi:hypothetical protein
MVDSDDPGNGRPVTMVQAAPRARRTDHVEARRTVFNRPT